MSQALTFQDSTRTAAPSTTWRTDAGTTLQTSLLHTDSAPTTTSYASSSSTTTTAFPPLAKVVSKQEFKRLVFVSVTNIEREFRKFDPQVFQDSIFLFDADRDWVFRPKDAPSEHHFDAKYIKIGEEFKDIIRNKEKEGLVCWFRPSCDWHKCSTFLESIDVDPMGDNAKKLSPLKLAPSWWLTLSALRDSKGSQIWDGRERHDGRHPEDVKPKFTNSISKIVTNFQSGSFDYNAVSELIYQSNPTLHVRTFL